MLKKNNGFTVIELIMSFIFASILSFTLLGAVLYYRDKEIDTSIETELLTFKSNLIIDIQQDIQKYVLKSMNYCTDASSNIISKCVELKFENGLVKAFKVDTILYVDTLYDDDGVPHEFPYEVPYISYGGIAYQIPDAANVTIRSDFMLQSTSIYDGIESNTPIYKLRVDLVHNDLDADMDISVVATGTENLAVGTTPYKSYSIGDRVSVQVGGATSRMFRVIENSSGYNGTVTLLYDDTSLGNYPFSNAAGNNNYESSLIKTRIDDLKTSWKNPSSIRLLTATEVGYLVQASPKFSGFDASNLSLSNVSTLNYNWLVSSSYWTMSGKVYSDTPGNAANINKKVWYVNGPNKLLTDDFITSSYQLRPVIVIEKRYINY